MPQLHEFISQLAPEMTQWRRDFHLHAESGWLEFRTASKVAGILDGLGYQLALGRDVIDADSRMGLPDDATLAQAFQRAREQGAPERWLTAFEGGFAGVVATLDTGRPGPTLAFRVDMDALDLNEQHDDCHRPHRAGFASCNAGMMHACGHDGHTAIGLGLAHVLQQYADRLNGIIKLIFQPAEEGTRGARAMVAAGVLDNVDYFTAIHIGTGVPSGTVVCGGDNFMRPPNSTCNSRASPLTPAANRKMGATRYWPPRRPPSPCTPSRRTAPAPHGLTSVLCRPAPGATWSLLPR